AHRLVPLDEVTQGVESAPTPLQRAVDARRAEHAAPQHRPDAVQRSATRSASCAGGPDAAPRAIAAPGAALSKHSSADWPATRVPVAASSITSSTPETSAPLSNRTALSAAGSPASASAGADSTKAGPVGPGSVDTPSGRM